MIVHIRDLDSISQDPGQQGRKWDLFEDEMFWEALSTITIGNLSLKIMPIDRIFTPYRFT